MRRALRDLFVLAAAATLVAAAVNLIRQDPFPLAVPAGLYQIESAGRPIRLPAARRLLEEGGTVFLDARSASAYADGRIAEALNLPFDDWAAFLPLVEPWFEDQPVVVYAGRGELSLVDDLAGVLADRSRVEALYLFVGGFEEWAEAGLPVASGPDPILMEEGWDDEIEEIDDWEEES